MVGSKHGIRNADILLVILGTFVFPMLNSFDGLVTAILKMLGFPIVSWSIFSVSFNGLIIFGLLYLLSWIYKNWSNDSEKLVKVLTLRKFRNYGLILLLVIIVDRTILFFVLKNLPDEGGQMESNNSFDIMRQITYLSLADTIMSALREVLLFVIFFVIVFKNKGLGTHYHQHKL